MSQCERCSWALLADGQLFCRNTGLPLQDVTQDDHACSGFRAGAPVVEWRKKPKGQEWKRLGER